MWFLLIGEEVLVLLPVKKDSLINIGSQVETQDLRTTRSHLTLEFMGMLNITKTSPLLNDRH